ncbi:39S ribosomal protein L17, mitochondrial [Zootermopsis nevadensis]|uniref:39S ribosomal protein L17, mitochondrial n=1 Tax=Zootermopsis nevadensis TaxID=136037 RepID=UPI000B8EA67B|nr:39S ribosomal protein L17, mitochondrial [Zootermopsis nevadensis]
MNQADVSKLMSRLKIKYSPVKRKLKNSEGPVGRAKKIQKTLTALIKHERIELNFNRADETRGYVERLISDAIRYGDCHRATMELADYWLLEKQLVHKLFKVLVPRFENCPVSYTRMYRAPRPCPGNHFERAVLELRGNPYPSLLPDTISNRNLIHNVLLDEAHKEYRAQKYAEIARKLEAADENVAKSSGDSDGPESSGLETPEEIKASTEAQVASEVQPSGEKVARPSKDVQ